jgi:hypothetical protein
MYRITSKSIFAVPLFLLLICVPAGAQAITQQGPSASDLPDKPEIKAPTPTAFHDQNRSSIPPRKVADKKFWVLAGFEVGATVADFETTQWAQRVRPDGGELNPLYGKHPGRARMYGIGVSITGVQILMQFKSKQKAQASGKSGKAWIVGALLNTGVHTFLAVHNGQIAGRGPGDCLNGAYCR